MTLTEMWRWGCLCVVGSGTGLSWGLGYPTGGWYNYSDWEDWVVRRGEEGGDGDNLGYTCNLLEHE